MSRATSLISRLGTVLRSVNANSRFVYKRVITRTGGDKLLGHPGNIDTVDILVDPPPIYQRVSKSEFGNGIPSEAVESNTVFAISNDYQITFSPVAISSAELTNPDLQIVFKDGVGNEEVFRITDFEPVSFQGIDVLLSAYIRSTSRTSQ